LFTRLIESVGVVRSVRKLARGARIEIETELADLSPGESVAVDGVCQTVAEIARNRFSCDVVPETLRGTTFGALRAGSRVNLERALGALARLGGHIVNGHVDGTGRVARISRTPRSIEIALEPALLRYVAPKGPVAVNGVSLTAGPEIRGGRFTVFVIPHTWDHTNLGGLRTGSAVNVEVDILAKYVERLSAAAKGSDRS
jgi:riboflavin synthase